MSFMRYNFDKEILAARLCLQNTYTETEFHSRRFMYRLAFAYGHLRMLLSMQQNQVQSPTDICSAAQTGMAQVYYGLSPQIEPYDLWKDNNHSLIYQLTLPYLFKNFERSTLSKSYKLFENLQNNTLKILNKQPREPNVLDQEIDELLQRLNQIMAEIIAINRQSQLAMFGVFPHNPLAMNLAQDDEDHVLAYHRDGVP